MMMDEGAINPSNPLVSAAAAIKIVDVAPVLAVDSNRHPGPGCRQLTLHRREVSGVDDIRPEILE